MDLILKELIRYLVCVIDNYIRFYFFFSLIKFLNNININIIKKIKPNNNDTKFE